MKGRTLVTLRSLVLLIAVAAPASLFANAKITIVNVNPPGVGFNDNTPAEPLPTNPGTTFGQQALNVFQYAADIWGATLDSPVEIKIRAQFIPLTPCSTTSGVIGSAGTRSAHILSGGFLPGPTIFGAALRNKLVGNDGSALEDIQAQFNSNIGTPTCLPSRSWYYGLDANTPTGKINLAAVLLHEFGHGLGFSTFVGSNGAELANTPDIFERHIRDTNLGPWVTLSPAQRAASARSESRLVFDGPNTNAAVPQVLEFAARGLRVQSPAAIANTYKMGEAQFGPAVSFPGVSGAVVAALGPAGQTDGCAPLANAAAVAGNIALIDRDHLNASPCGVDVKVKHAQDAGATAVIMVDSATGGVPPGALNTTDAVIAASIVIPSVQVTPDTGLKLRNNLSAGVQVIIGLEPDRRRGADIGGRAMLYAPDPFNGGSSVSHFDTTASRNVLMEPFISADLTHSLQPPYDLTASQMLDIGWFPDGDVDGVANSGDNCPTTANANQADADADARGDVCDNCPSAANFDQADNDSDGAGDACDSDDDNDGVPDTADNCQFTANANQANYDGDAAGDLCDPDDDNDGVADSADRFQFSDIRATVVIAGCDSGSPNLRFADGSTLGDLVGALRASARNHGDFQSGVSALLNDLVKSGQLSGAQKGAITSCAGQSNQP